MQLAEMKFDAGMMKGNAGNVGRIANRGERLIIDLMPSRNVVSAGLLFTDAHSEL